MTMLLEPLAANDSKAAPHAPPRRLCKFAEVRGRTLVFRDAVVDDAAFIVALRTDQRLGRHLSATSADVAPQRAWLERYRDDSSQAYFIITDAQGEALGTVRLYDVRGGSFCWGSWILSPNAPAHASIESALMVYALAFDHLRFDATHFDVRRDNVKVWQFHERMGAVRVDENELDIFYTLPASVQRQAGERYRRYLPSGVTTRPLGS